MCFIYISEDIEDLSMLSKEDLLDKCKELSNELEIQRKINSGLYVVNNLHSKKR